MNTQKHAKHSPLPWRTENPDGANGVIVDAAGEVVLCITDNPDTGMETPDDEPSLHNQRLVLNAVNLHTELLAALEDCCDAFAFAENPMDVSINRARNNARALIARSLFEKERE